MRTASPADPRSGGFASLGEFARSVRAACVTSPYNPADQRLRALMAAPGELSGETTGEGGGYAAPPVFLPAIMQAILSPTSLVGRVTTIPLPKGGQVSLPVDETPPWATGGGIRCYWSAEAGQLTQVKPLAESRTLKLRKVTALVPCTDEVLDDAPALDAWLRLHVPERIGWKLNDAFLNGDGNGKPLGMLNSGAKITVAKDGSQTADTFTIGNARAMAARLYGPARERAVWVMNPDAFAQVETFAWPYFAPAGTAGPEPRLLGMPVLLNEACAALGDEGDVVLCDPAAYLTARRAREDFSAHFWFDQDMSAYRFVVRIDGQPLIRSPIVRPRSANTASSIVTVEARS